MKTLKLIGLAFAALFLFSACNDSDGDYAQWRTIATVRTPANGSYYFELDNGKTMYPSINHVNGYPAKNGQRAAIYFNYQDGKVEKFDYNIALYALSEILTKDVKIVTTKEELDALGYDGINVLGSDMYIGNEFLTLVYYVPAINNSEIHEFNLVVDNTTPETLAESNIDIDPDYTDVLLRHNASGKIQEYSTLSYISFKLNSIHPIETGKKGLRIHVKKVNGEVTSYLIDYKADETKSFNLQD